MKKIIITTLTSIICATSFAQIQPNEHNFSKTKDYQRMHDQEKQKLLQNCWDNFTQEEKNYYNLLVSENRQKRKAVTFEDKSTLRKYDTLKFKEFEQKCNLPFYDESEFRKFIRSAYHFDNR